MRRLYPAALAVIVVYLALVTALALTKRPYGDEVLFANPAIDLITRGTMGVSVLEPTGSSVYPGRNLIRVNVYDYLGMPLPYVTLAGWFRVFGAEVFSMRSLSIAWGFLALAAWFLIVKELTGNRALALLAALLVATDRAFLESASDGRADMMSAALSFAAIAAYLVLRHRRFTAAVLAANALLAACLLTHPNGMVGALALAYLALSLDRSRLRWRHLALAAAPYLAAAAAWGLFISLDPEAFRAQFLTNASGRLGGLMVPWQGLVDEIRLRYLEGFYLPPSASGIRVLRVLIPLGYLAAVLGVLGTRAIRSKPGYRTLAVFAVLYFGVMAVFEGHKNYYYLVHVTPVLASVLAVYLHHLWTSGGLRRAAGVTVAALLMSLQVGWAALSVKQDPYHTQFLPASEYLRKHAPPPALVMGSCEFGFVLGFYNNLVDDATLGYYSGKRADFIVIDPRTYGQTFAAFQERYPALDQHVTMLLTQAYRKVYDGPYYEIYARRPGAG